MARHAAGSLGHPARVVLARLVVAFDPTHSAFNWLIVLLGGNEGSHG